MEIIQRMPHVVMQTLHPYDGDPKLMVPDSGVTVKAHGIRTEPGIGIRLPEIRSPGTIRTNLIGLLEEYEADTAGIMSCPFLA